MGIHLSYQNSLLGLGFWPDFSYNLGTLLGSSSGLSGLESCINLRALTRLTANLGLACPLML
ncbi:hypothetical protein EGK_08919 [Macaca mulatta]|uniref:Uncharacterized protein n=2 Tax=Macaca TaxID=9539 RepID=F6Y6N7_MACMU|nr:hypothetical protein EGK_08919 [Macaca mulatta]EHH58290.1 hypothetical protein EGM_08106 [Macaca fascicularis]